MNRKSNTSGGLSAGGIFLVALGLAVIAVFGLRTISHSDFWMHLATGRWIAENGIPRTDVFSWTASGAPWADGSWLYDRVIFGLWNLGGAKLLVVLNAVVAVLTFLCLVPVARRWAGGNSIALALLLAAWLIAPRLTVSPQVLALLFAAVFTLVLAEVRKPVVAWAVLLPLQVVWTNVHVSFLAGPALCGVFLVEAWIRARNSPPGAPGTKALALRVGVLAATLAVTILNPYGLGLHRAAWGAWSNVAFNYVQEWISPFSGQFPSSGYARHFITLALLVGAGGLVAERRKLPVALTTLAVFSAFLVVRSLRFVEIFAVMAMPFLALSFEALGGFIGGRLEPALKERMALLHSGVSAGVALLAAASVLLTVTGAVYAGSGSASRFGMGAEYDLFPVAAAEVVVRPDFPGRAVNLTPDGGFLAWRVPGHRIFVDHRANLYGAKLFQSLALSLAGAEEAWGEIEDSWDPGAAILNCTVPGSGSLARNLLAGGRWVLVYFDGTTAILVRAVSENQALARDARIQASGLGVLETESRRYATDLKASRVARVSPRVIGAAHLLMALGRFGEARGFLELMLNGSPDMSGAWFNLGLCQLELGDAAVGVESLERAGALAPRNAGIWLQLSRAYALHGKPEESRQAFARAEKLNPRAAQRFKEAASAPTPATPQSK